MADASIDGDEQTPAEVEAEAEAPQYEADPVLLAARELGRAALLEITSTSSIGPFAGYVVEGEHLLSLQFENTLTGYPGWFWTVTLSREAGSDEVNVLETELLPGDGALLAPEWTPWSERLAEYQAQQKALREAAEAAGEPVPEDLLETHADDIDEPDEDGEPDDDDPDEDEPDDDEDDDDSDEDDDLDDGEDIDLDDDDVELDDSDDDDVDDDSDEDEDDFDDEIDHDESDDLDDFDDVIE